MYVYCYKTGVLIGVVNNEIKPKRFSHLDFARNKPTRYLHIKYKCVDINHGTNPDAFRHIKIIILFTIKGN